MTYFFGKLDPHPVSSDLKWSELRKPLKAMGALKAIPAHFGHGGTYPDWRMLGNGPTLAGEPSAPSSWTGFNNAGGCGNCVWASAAHEVLESLTDALTWPVPPAKLREILELFDTEVVVNEYAKVTGYNPVSGEHDEGTEIRTRLLYMHETGILDTKGKRNTIGPPVELEAGNQEHRLEAAYFFEAVPLGVQVGNQQEEAFNTAEQNGTTPIWDVGTPEGGHCIPEVGRPNDQYETSLSWAKRVWCTPAFLEKQCDEAWCYSSTERINAITGKTEEGITPEQLEEYLHTLGKAATN